MRAALQRLWLHPGAGAWALWPLTLPLRIAVAVRRGLYRHGTMRQERLPVPVVVVGSVLVGGTGKTPLLMLLVRHLLAQGHHPAIVSRGYGRATADCREATASSTPDEVGDEPALLARSCGVPVFVARRRVEAARALLASYPATDVILSDDGLQHLALRRDIEICVFDDRGTGNGMLLPAGPLREPWPRAADLVVHTGARPAFDGFAVTRTLEAHAVDGHGTRQALVVLRDTPLTALAGIGQPEQFFAMLRAAGLRIERTVALPDHYEFDSNKAPWGALERLICTEKDAIKLWRTRPDAWAVGLKLDAPPELLAAFDRLLRERTASRLSSNDGQQAA